MAKIIGATGYIDRARLESIPARHRVEHEFCFLIHDYMVHLMKEFERTGGNRIQINFRNNENRERFINLAEDDVIGALELLEYNEEAELVIVSNVCVALYADFLHFIHDGMIALEKRKFTVALSLFRKPLKENLFLAAWLCGDKADFLRAFAKAPDVLMDSYKIQKGKRLDVYRKCISSINNKEIFSAQFMYDLLYKKDNQSGLGGLFDKAMHLVTGSKPILKTESQNLNFIFKNPMDNDIYESLYRNLSYLLFFSLMIQQKLYGKIIKIENQYIAYSETVALGCFSSIYGKGNVASKFLTKDLKEFLKCPYCKAPITITKNAAPRFLMTETVVCSRCSEFSQFPLFWLMSQADWSSSD